MTERSRQRIWISLLVAGEVVIVASLFALASCGGAADEPPEAEQPAAVAVAEMAAETQPATAPTQGTTGYTIIEVTDGGTIRGTVRFQGEVPPPHSMMVKDDVEACGELQSRQPIETGGNGGLADVVVSLTDVTRGSALETPGPPITLDQRGCRFEPHVALAPTGEPVQVLNSDPITHNIHTVTFDNRAVNRAQPAGVRQIEVTFKVPEKVKVKCDIHEWMGAWIVAIDHPYHAITDQNGSFVLEDVPAGTYTLELWHETLGSTTRTVTVTAGETSILDASLSES
jgi:plastocyanin